MITNDEKIILLASLFHDVGKFEQRCNNRRVTHQELGVELLTEYHDQLVTILGSSDGVTEVKALIKDHHNRDKSSTLLDILKSADHLSASERVEFSEADSDLNQKWSHKYLTSLFSKIYLNSKDDKQLRYYEHKELSKKDYKILIPSFESEKDIRTGGHSYTEANFNKFRSELKLILDFYEDDNDFESLINLALILFEKYMWCIPDFTGSDQTDISLYNHIKDVAGIAHALYKLDDTKDKKLNLIIGDLPGIQKYIFNVANKKPAKILRGRSIYVQILTRQFASIFLKTLGLTEANLIMLAGGKFYILAQQSNDFESLLNKALTKIETILIKNFNYQLNFSAVYETFDYESLKGSKESFGSIIDRASYKLLQQRNQQFKRSLFNNNDFNESRFILHDNYVKRDDDSNKVKCAVTGIPISEGREVNLPDSDNGDLIDKQVLNEIKIGQNITKSNLVIEFSNEYDAVIDVKPIGKYKASSPNANRILLNPNLEELLDPSNLKKDILRNTLILEVANYTSNDTDDKNAHVMEFDTMENKNNGANFMTLIKGDVDNLGLIMSSGLVDDSENLTAMSRTTTLSNHLKYFFSFAINGFLKDWESGAVVKTVDDEYTNDQKVYTIFAGGDDLMLVSPQSSSLKLLDALNENFNDFVCKNKEVHISYSLTNFKHNTPIRIVADIAEDNQNKVKSDFKAPQYSKNKNHFYAENNKAGVRIFDTNLKNDLVKEIIKLKKSLVGWEKDDRNKVSQGVLRNLLYFSKIMKDFEETKDTQFLMWHPKLNYMINRTLKKNDSQYHNPEIEQFFENALKLNKADSLDAFILKQILYPVVCEAIYGTRNS